MSVYISQCVFTVILSLDALDNNIPLQALLVESTFYWTVGTLRTYVAHRRPARKDPKGEPRISFLHQQRVEWGMKSNINTSKYINEFDA
jgi:hypothetical protein